MLGNLLCSPKLPRQVSVTLFITDNGTRHLSMTASATAAYEFTTLTVGGVFEQRGFLTIYFKAIPGVIEYSGARIQLLDLPGIVEGASQGKL